MATTRPSRAAQPARAVRPNRATERRARQASEQRTERRVYLAAAVVGIAVVLIVAVGVLLTVVMPPRTKVVTVGSRTFTAADVAVRAKYAVVGEQNSAVSSNPDAIIPTLMREETLRQKVGDLGVSASDDDLKAELRKRVGTPADQSDDVFRAAYDRYIETLPVSRAEFEEIARAEVLRTKTVDSFKAKVGEKGPQLHLLAVASQDKQKLDEMRTAVAAGKDFAAEAVVRGFVKEPAQADLAWFDPQSLPDRISPVRDLKAGELSEVFMDDQTGGYFLALAAERSDDRAYDDTVKTQVANRQFLEWVKVQEAALAGEPSLTGGAKTWVVRQVREALAEAQRRAQAQQAAK